MRREVGDLLREAWWLLREALSSVHSPVTRRLPVVVITRKAQAERERNAFDIGRDAERYYPRPLVHRDSGSVGR